MLHTAEVHSELRPQSHENSKSIEQEQYNDKKGTAELDAVEIHAPEDNDNEFDHEEKTPVRIRRATSIRKGKQTETCTRRTNQTAKLTLTQSFDILELERAKQENLQADRMLEEQEMKAKILQENYKQKRRGGRL